MSELTIPRHIAVIMDGNGRWAKNRHLPRSMGHRAGAKAVRNLVENCARLGVQVLTLFAFSSENWHRPAKEVDGLMKLFFDSLDKELPTLQKNQIRLRIIGDKSKLSETLRQRIIDVEQQTAQNQHMTLVLAVSYGGRWDICQAVKTIAEKVQANELNIDDINEQLLAETILLSDLPEPDLLIRTSGEQRISNFMIWQLAYSEFYFTEKLWPEFDKQQLQLAIEHYNKRERRFGLTSEQLQGDKN